MKSSCSLCSNAYQIIPFKGGAVCEDCLTYIRRLQQPIQPTVTHFK